MGVRIRFTPFPQPPERQRILFTIAHYYGPSPDGKYGSTRGSAADERRVALERTISNLHQVVAQPQALVHGPIHGFLPANIGTATEVKVVVCTTGDRHLVDQLELPSGSFEHRATDSDGPFLGYECHAVLRERMGEFDWLCYLEDDIGIEDSSFFQKLGWFAGWAGEDALLQPNRFETSDRAPIRRLYIDGEPVRPDKIGYAQDLSEQTWLEREFLGRPTYFRRVTNAHSGCFFLTRAQMASWASKPDFLTRERAFVGPLESAATLGIVRHFRVYKPERANASFLEVRHIHNRYLDRLLDFVP